MTLISKCTTLPNKLRRHTWYTSSLGQPNPKSRVHGYSVFSWDRTRIYYIKDLTIVFSSIYIMMQLEKNYIPTKSENVSYLNRTRLSSRIPVGNALIVMYTPGTSCSIHSDSISLALLNETSPERSPSLDELVLAEASIDDVSVFPALMLDNFGVEARAESW